ncbi:MAG: hypothetical protein IPM54_27925 [Polyangiaceae bacterium]|nr:hypothetical protein [Polyangiaceae bacterium]
MKYKYMSGIEVMEGDAVMVHHHREPAEGVVLHVLLPNSPEAEAWGVPEGGVMIEGGGLGLFATHYLEDDEDIVFVRRGGSEP